jgi:hypothetical protein
VSSVDFLYCYAAFSNLAFKIIELRLARCATPESKRRLSVYPRAVFAFVLLGGFVRPRLIALGVPPQPREGERKSGWRLGRCE